VIFKSDEKFKSNLRHQEILWTIVVVTGWEMKSKSFAEESNHTQDQRENQQLCEEKHREENRNHDAWMGNEPLD
jgi:hypothetical protein